MGAFLLPTGAILMKDNAKNIDSIYKVGYFPEGVD